MLVNSRLSRGDESPVVAVAEVIPNIPEEDCLNQAITILTGIKLQGVDFDSEQ